MDKEIPVAEMLFNEGMLNIETFGNSEKYSVEFNNAFPYTFLTESEFDVNTDSTTEIAVGEIPLEDFGRIATSGNVMFFIEVRDKNGKRPGYFYGTDTIIIKTGRYVTAYTVNTSGSTLVRLSSAYGVYVAAPTGSAANKIEVKARYHATNSLTIDGSYSIKVYTLEWYDKTPFAQ